LLSAIVFVKDGNKEQFLKYRNIGNTQHKKNQFILMIKRKFPDAKHINWYRKSDKVFLYRDTIAR
jgi:hypothetical protein